MVLPNAGSPPAARPGVRAGIDRPLSDFHPDHPVRRMVECGGRDLSLLELFGVLVDNGRDVRQALQRGMAVCGAARDRDGAPSLRVMRTLSPGALAQKAGVSIRAAARLLAAFELGRREVAEERPGRVAIRRARDAHDHLRLRLRDLQQEEFYVLLLDAQHALIRDVLVSRGLLDATLVHAREVFRPAIEAAASALVLVHNHPSGEPAPSAGDVRITEAMIAAGRLLDIHVLDHVIVGDGRYFSFAESPGPHRRLLAEPG